MAPALAGAVAAAVLTDVERAEARLRAAAAVADERDRTTVRGSDLQLLLVLLTSLRELLADCRPRD